MVLSPAPDIKKRIDFLAKELSLLHINYKNIFCFRSTGSTGRAYARIWSLPKIWQMGLNIEAHYCIEVMTEKFARHSTDEPENNVVHELM